MESCQAQLLHLTHALATLHQHPCPSTADNQYNLRPTQDMYICTCSINTRALTPANVTRGGKAAALQAAWSKAKTAPAKKAATGAKAKAAPAGKRSASVKVRFCCCI